MFSLSKSTLCDFCARSAHVAFKGTCITVLSLQSCNQYSGIFKWTLGFMIIGKTISKLFMYGILVKLSHKKTLGPRYPQLSQNVNITCIFHYMPKNTLVVLWIRTYCALTIKEFPPHPPPATFPLNTNTLVFIGIPANICRKIGVPAPPRNFANEYVIIFIYNYNTQCYINHLL